MTAAMVARINILGVCADLEVVVVAYSMKRRRRIINDQSIEYFAKIKYFIFSWFFCKCYCFSQLISSQYFNSILLQLLLLHVLSYSLNLFQCYILINFFLWSFPKFKKFYQFFDKSYHCYYYRDSFSFQIAKVYIHSMRGVDQHE